MTVAYARALVVAERSGERFAGDDLADLVEHLIERPDLTVAEALGRDLRNRRLFGYGTRSFSDMPERSESSPPCERKRRQFSQPHAAIKHPTPKGQKTNPCWSTAFMKLVLVICPREQCAGYLGRAETLSVLDKSWTCARLDRLLTSPIFTAAHFL